MAPPSPDRAALVIPTYNAGLFLERMIPALERQTFMPASFLVIDSGSADDTVERFAAAGARIHSITPDEFDHGGTRQLAVDMLPHAEIIVFLTHDAIPADPQSFAHLVRVFEDPQIGVAYGRQLPHPDASPLGAHARLFNYPDKSLAHAMADAERDGIKAAFCSNSFAAYRTAALKEAGGFPDHTIIGEDTLAAAAIMAAGWTKSYVAEARVYHSHSYTIREEFARYFDIGVMHASAHSLIKQFGKPESEGRRFVLSELSFLWHGHRRLIPSAMVRSASKYLGYRLGLAEANLPLTLKRRLSMNHRFWTKPDSMGHEKRA